MYLSLFLLKIQKHVALNWLVASIFFCASGEQLGDPLLGSPSIFCKQLGSQKNRCEPNGSKICFFGPFPVILERKSSLGAIIAWLGLARRTFGQVEHAHGTQIFGRIKYMARRVGEPKKSIARSFFASRACSRQA